MGLFLGCGITCNQAIVRCSHSIQCKPHPAYKNWYHKDSDKICWFVSRMRIGVCKWQVQVQEGKWWWEHEFGWLQGWQKRLGKYVTWVVEFVQLWNHLPWHCDRMETALFAQPPGFSCTFTPQMGCSCGFRTSPDMGIFWGCMVPQAQAAPQWWRRTCCCCGTCSGTVSPNKARASEHPGKQREMGGTWKASIGENWLVKYLRYVRLARISLLVI